ncbi:DUF2244 domain-containing protein [Microvirga sp. 2MCAF38]|uniref:DUF2244 domain-containing protein n=1 Tax=Microvirga sp. 2MCAF38 TaxID=3232989 RepID=UPI003F980967
MDSGKATLDEIGQFERPVFAAVIRPHRSLTPKGFRVVMTLVCLTSLIASLPFVILGFWPVVGFFGLDFLGLYIALRVNDRHGRAFEEVILTPVRLLLRKVSYRGESREWSFNPLWTRLNRQEDDEFGLQQLALTSRGQSVVVAHDLSPPERETFAEAFGQALANVKRGI